MFTAKNWQCSKKTGAFAPDAIYYGKLSNSSRRLKWICLCHHRISVLMIVRWRCNNLLYRCLSRLCRRLCWGAWWRRRYLLDHMGIWYMRICAVITELPAATWFIITTTKWTRLFPSRGRVAICETTIAVFFNNAVGLTGWCAHGAVVQVRIAAAATWVFIAHG